MIPPMKYAATAMLYVDAARWDPELAEGEELGSNLLHRGPA
jgi:hypothetical protein